MSNNLSVEHEYKHTAHKHTTHKDTTVTTHVFEDGKYANLQVPVATFDDRLGTATVVDVQARIVLTDGRYLDLPSFQVDVNLHDLKDRDATVTLVKSIIDPTNVYTRIDLSLWPI